MPFLYSDPSLFGKFHIIKSIGMSMVMYASNMLNIEEKYLDRISRLNYSFLWNGKRPLIRKEICELPRNLGGLGMPDISLVIKTQKIQWIKRILLTSDIESWNYIPLVNFKCLDSKFGVDMFALRVNDCSSIFEKVKITTFYRKMIQYFQELKRKSEVYENQRQIIWCNNRFKFNGKPLYFAHWSKSGIIYLNDLLTDGKIDEDHVKGILLSKASYIFDIFKVRHAISNHMPNEYSQAHQYDTVYEEILCTKFKNTKQSEKCLKNLTSKEIYMMFLNNKGTEIKSKSYWKEKFKNPNLDFDLWFTCNLNSSIIPRKCIDFNWKIFHGKICTETILKKMKFSDGICCVCNNEIENVDHLLLKCQGIDVVWKYIENIIMKFMKTKIILNEKIILGGILKESFECEVVNLMLSIARYIIWKRRNRIKYEQNILNIDACIKWINYEVKLQIKILLKVKQIVKSKTKVEVLERLYKIL